MTPEQFRMHYVAVILGAGRQGLRLARDLFSRFGATCHVVDSSLSPLYRLVPWLTCHSLPSNCSPDVTLMALHDLAAEIEQNDRTPLLFVTASRVPFSPEQYTDELGAHYLIAHSPDEPFGHEPL